MAYHSKTVKGIDGLFSFFFLRTTCYKDQVAVKHVLKLRTNSKLLLKQNVCQK